MAYFYANPNPKKKLVIDCVVRAVSIVTDRSWHDVFFDICAEGGVLCDMPSSNLVWKKYLEEKGFTMDNIPILSCTGIRTCLIAENDQIKR